MVKVHVSSWISYLPSISSCFNAVGSRIPVICYRDRLADSEVPKFDSLVVTSRHNVEVVEL